MAVLVVLAEQIGEVECQVAHRAVAEVVEEGQVVEEHAAMAQMREVQAAMALSLFPGLCQEQALK